MTQKEMKQTDTGRSMVEMLGVLSIIGVLSVGGILGYKYGMDKHHSNDLLNDVSKASVVLSQKAVSGDIVKDDDLDKDFGTDMGAYPFTLYGQDEDNPSTFQIEVSGVPEVVCSMTLENPLPLAQTIYLGDDRTVIYENGAKVTEPSCVKGENIIAWDFNPALSANAIEGSGTTEEEDEEETTCRSELPEWCAIAGGTFNSATCKCNVNSCPEGRNLVDGDCCIGSDNYGSSGMSILYGEVTDTCCGDIGGFRKDGDCCANGGGGYSIFFRSVTEICCEAVNGKKVGNDCCGGTSSILNGGVVNETCCKGDGGDWDDDNGSCSK